MMIYRVTAIEHCVDATTHRRSASALIALTEDDLGAAAGHFRSDAGLC